MSESNGFGKYDIYAVSKSVYCYADSTVLRNKLKIRNTAELRAVETDISLLRQYEMLENPVLGYFTQTHLCRIHRYLLGDIYPFAGHFRKEDIAKGNTRFLSYKEVKEKLSILLHELREEKFLSGLNRSEFCKRSAYYMAELNYIHPFREGNGRTIREFMRQLFQRNGYSIDWGIVKTDELMQAMIDSVFDAKSLEKTLCLCLKTND